MLHHDMVLNSAAPPNPQYAAEYFTGVYPVNTNFVINLTNYPDSYRYAFISAELGQAATGTQYTISITVNGVSCTVPQFKVSNDGNSSASATAAHTLVRIPDGNTMTVNISNGYPLNGGYHIGVFRLPFLNYSLSSQTGGAASSSNGPFNITEYTNGLVLATFRGTYGSSADISFTGVTRLPGNVSNGLLSMAGGYGFSTSNGTRSVSVSHSSSDLRVTSVSSWIAS